MLIKKKINKYFTCLLSEAFTKISSNILYKPGTYEQPSF